MWAKQSTAATLIVGPILDSTGAEFTTAVIGDLSLSKNGGTLTALAAAATLTHVANGQYTLVLTTGNLDTLGRAQITCNKATYQMPAVNLMVVPAMVFDSMILGTDVLTADVTQIGGDTQSATDLKDFADAGYDPATNTVAAVLDSASIDAIWNEILTGATHNIASSAGRRLRQLADTVVLVDGVCDAASNAGTDSTGTITLELGTTTACVGQAIRSENQVRFIASYDAGTRIAQLDRPWCVVPDAGDEYVIFNVRNPLVGLASLALAGSTAAAVNDVNAVTDKIDTGLVLDGAVYQFTANMLELGPSGGGGSTVNVLPATGIVANRTPGATLTPVVGETISQSITLYSTDGITPINLSGKTLVVVFETLAGTDVATVASANITISGVNSNVVTFAYPSAVTASERTLRFAIRDAAAPLTMYLQGLCSVVRAPQVDP
jgi:hypothetical protein